VAGVKERSAVGQEEVAEIKAELKEIKQAQGKIYDRLTRLDTLIEERCGTRGRTLEDTKEKVDRLRIAQAKIIGAAAVLSVTITYILKGLGVMK
jgi:hypothetical protein